MNGTENGSRIGRSILAVLAGMAVVVVLSVGTDAAMEASGVFPPGGQRMPDPLFLLPTAYRAIYAILGCYLAARLAPRRPMRHALVLGLVGVLASAAGTIAKWNELPDLGPTWYAIAVFAMTLPCAWIGGRLAEMRGAAQPRGA